ncbi:MAG: helix-turn-helix domain-containing protein [Fibrobacteria bacterium]|nr:helix-turn-helix domain-containing protein [Fibrobacteria bacterium]
MDESKLPDSSDLNESLGKLLKAARESAGYTPESLSQEIRLNQDILIALETQQYDKLPPFPYIRAFLVTLCKHLKLNQVEILQKLNLEMGVKPEKIIKEEDPAPKPIVTRKRKRASISIFIGLLAITIITFYNIGGKVPPPKVEDFASPADSQRDHIKPGNDIPDRDTIKKESDVVTLSDSGFKEPVGAPPELETPPEPVTPASTAKEIKKSPPIQTNDVASSKTNSLVTFECIVDSVWLGVKKKGKRNLNKIITNGNIWKVAHSDSIFITSGVIGGFRLYINGIPFHPKKAKFIIYKGQLIE